VSDVAGLVKKPWARLPRQSEAATFGTWAFLASEALFFGALLLAYTANRIEHPDAFVAAARETNVFYGTLNTAILLTSSWTMAVAAQAAQKRADFHRLIGRCLAATALIGVAFLIVKGLEYREDIEKHLVPGPTFPLADPASQIFFALYWVITGVHAIHLTIGIGLVTRLAVISYIGRTPLRRNPQLEVVALYWHLVDIIWVLVYPLIYLPGRQW
jgi:cytochrome c oxidase subunit 3